MAGHTNRVRLWLRRRRWPRCPWCGAKDWERDGAASATVCGNCLAYFFENGRNHPEIDRVSFQTFDALRVPVRTWNTRYVQP